jgi:hypothetical protein
LCSPALFAEKSGKDGAFLDDVKPVAVEKWLRSLDLAPWCRYLGESINANRWLRHSEAGAFFHLLPGVVSCDARICLLYI